MTQTVTHTYREETLATTKGLQLFLRSWKPSGTARAAIAIVHGFNSHGGHYLWVGDQLAAHGFATYAIDLRGRGRSDGERYYIESFTDYLDDVTAFTGLVKTREAGLPLFLLGHSAGGVISCSWALEHQAALTGLICESFAYQVYAPDFAVAALKGLSHLAPHAHVLKLKIDDFSRDPAVLRAMHEDPAIAHEVQPTLTVAEMARADDRLAREFRHLTLPVLILHGTADKVTRPEGSQEFFDNAGSSDKTLKMYDGHAHDLLNDLDKGRVLGDIITWIQQRS